MLCPGRQPKLVIPFRSRSTAILTLLSTALPLLAQDVAARKPIFRAPTHVGTLPAKEIPEASGLVRSRRHAGIYWTHNDSGGEAEVFAIRADGSLVRRVAIPDAENIDWEDIALDHRNRLVVADIGDNLRLHDGFTLYRFAEPDPAGTESTDPVTTVDTFRCRYPRELGPVDAEALFVSGDHAFVLTKERQQTRLFRIPLEDKGDAPSMSIIAELVGTLDDLGNVTAATLSDDGLYLVILTYLKVVVLDLARPFEPALPAAELSASLPHTPRRQQPVLLGQCEGITFDGPDLVVVTEKGPFTWGQPMLWRLAPDVSK